MPKAPDTPASDSPSHKATDKDSVLTLVLVDPEGKDDHYAVVPFPETYEDAEAAAVKTLGKYMPGDAPDIILRRSLKNRKGEWVWADIPPEHWKATVARGSTEVGVFGQPRITREVFVHGPVHFTYCKDNGNGISWPEYSVNLEALPDTSKGMDRPKSFAAACVVARAKLRDNWINMADTEKDTFTFCFFPGNNLFTWVPIPKVAHTDDALWQQLVPQPGEILGVIINWKGP
ncbi:hypothetical protein FPV67DRAFT_1530592 [Lyophyllum atratum]|nr:hypothetical protein FPV67DRAFT_1530592 [Lyophyllum atratum]